MSASERADEQAGELGMGELGMGELGTTVLYEVSDGVATLTLHRPHRKNAWTFDMERDLFAAMDRADADEDVRVIVLTATGTVFCPGADTAMLSERSSEDRSEQPEWRTHRLYHARLLRKPVIASVNGACAGVGLVLAVSADIRFAAGSAKFSPAFARRGMPVEGGLTWMLPRLIGAGAASELLISARVVLAEEALRLGLVNRLYPDDELAAATRAYAVEIAANCSPLAMASVKEQLDLDVSRSLEQSHDDFWIRLNRPEQRVAYREGVASFVEKRPVAFAPLGPRETDE
ncbi:MAG TPA: enoyl-CoA hydratase-related protein [Pseudonocardia sp.]|nr:enoyl-CoA hydratase-related protein [Pseudonocardia sp.]